MAAKLDLGKALSQAAQAAGEMAKDASAAIESAAKGATNAAEGAGNVIVDTATSASEAIGSAMCSVAEGMSSAGEQIASSDAGKTITGAANTVGGIAIGAAVNLAQGASSLRPTRRRPWRAGSMPSGRTHSPRDSAGHASKVSVTESSRRLPCGREATQFHLRICGNVLLPDALRR